MNETVVSINQHLDSVLAIANQFAGQKKDNLTQYATSIRDVVKTTPVLTNLQVDHCIAMANHIGHFAAFYQTDERSVMDDLVDHAGHLSELVQDLMI